MALQTASPPTTPSAQVVGNAFVEQYYHILHHSPDLVYRFYHDSSVLSRPDSNGAMTSVTTMQGINEKICSLDYKEYKAEIQTADAQKSYKDGVTVLVTGCLTGKDNLRRKFAQSFFLAPQDNGYFVLNDVFRFLEDEQLEKHPDKGIDDNPKVPIIPDPEPSHVPDPPAPDPATSHREEDPMVVEKAYDPSDHERPLVNEKVAVIEPQSYSNGNDIPAVAESASSSSAQEDTPKKSYASIVKVTQGSSGPTKVFVPASTVKLVPKKTENQSLVSTASAPVPEASAPISTSTHGSSNAREEVEGHSIYIQNLPLNVTADQVEVELKKFGPIKQGGIQVRNHKLGYCYAFVEYQSLSSMNSAIQASPITVEGHQAVVEIKRTTTQVGGGRGGRYPYGRGGFRNENFRGRGNYGGGRDFGRNEYVSRGDYSGRGRGPAGRGGENYQGRGRGGRSGGPRQNVSSA